MGVAIHDEMDIAKFTLKELLSASKTKALLSNILDNVVRRIEEKCGGRERYYSSDKSTAESMSTRNHEEADTVIPLYVIDAIGDSSLRDIDVWSPDTDVLILLMDLVAHGRLGGFTKLDQYSHWKRRQVSIDHHS